MAAKGNQFDFIVVGSKYSAHSAFKNLSADRDFVQAVQPAVPLHRV